MNADLEALVPREREEKKNVHLEIKTARLAAQRSETPFLGVIHCKSSKLRKEQDVMSGYLRGLEGAIR